MGLFWEKEWADSYMPKHVKDPYTWLVYMFYTTVPFDFLGLFLGNTITKIYASSALTEGMSLYPKSFIEMFRARRSQHVDELISQRSEWNNQWLFCRWSMLTRDGDVRQW